VWGEEGAIELDGDLEEEKELHGGAGWGPPLRARWGCWTGSSIGVLDEELDEDLHGEELNGVMDGELIEDLHREELPSREPPCSRDHHVNDRGGEGLGRGSSPGGDVHQFREMKGNRELKAKQSRGGFTRDQNERNDTDGV
jgi:hypothetical protein